MSNNSLTSIVVAPCFICNKYSSEEGFIDEWLFLKVTGRYPVEMGFCSLSCLADFVELLYGRMIEDALEKEAKAAKVGFGVDEKIP